MKLFDFLRFNKNSNGSAKSFHTISDLFQFNLDEINESEFTKKPVNTSQTVGVHTHLELSLFPKERGLFDKLEIKKLSSNKYENFIFTKLKLRRGDIPKVKLLVNDLVTLLGIDSTNAGKFKSDDILDLKSDYWTGRSWIENKFDTPIMLGFDSETGLTLVISRRKLAKTQVSTHLG